MARLVKRTEDATWYVPDIGDNREDEDPFMVLLSPLNGAEMRKLEQAGMGKLTKARGQINFFKRAQDIQERIVKERVLEVKNYAVQDESGDVFTPKNGEDLLKAVLLVGAAEAEVIDDIVEALKDASKLDEGLLKNLKLQFDSPQVETQPLGNGVALSAKATPAATASVS